MMAGNGSESGDILIASGSGDQSGLLTLVSGTGETFSGNLTIGTADPTDGASGDIMLTTGAASTGTTGDISLSTGSATERQLYFVVAIIVIYNCSCRLCIKWPIRKYIHVHWRGFVRPSR